MENLTNLIGLSFLIHNFTNKIFPDIHFHGMMARIILRKNIVRKIYWQNFPKRSTFVVSSAVWAALIVFTDFPEDKIQPNLIILFYLKSCNYVFYYLTQLSISLYANWTRNAWRLFPFHFIFQSMLSSVKLHLSNSLWAHVEP